MATTPPGWYDDGRGALRWWDGQQWTEHVQTPDPEPATEQVSEQAPAAPTLAGARTPDPRTADTIVAPGIDPAAAAGYAPSAPPGYPGGFIGGAAPSGGFIAATEPKKSKLWILWVVLGVVLLGIVILAAVLIPLMIGLFGNVASSAGGGGNGGASDADEAAAVAAVQLYDEAWRTIDCDKFTQATTEELRGELQLADCKEFTAAATTFSTSVENYTLTVTSVERDGDEMSVETSEAYDALYDDEDNLLDEPTPYEDVYDYTVVPSAGGWAVDDLDTD